MSHGRSIYTRSLWARLTLPALLLGTTPALAEDEPQTPPAAETPAADGPQVDVGGALRFSYFYKSWDAEQGNRDRFGDLAFDMLQLDFDVEHGSVRLASAYRLYAGFHMLRHGWIGWRPADDIDVQIGLAQVPFGILPYASHNWWFNLGYYVGFEADFDLGAQVAFDLGDVDLQVGVFKNGDGQFTGSSPASARYSFDVLAEGTADVQETNQLNLRGTYTMRHGEGASTEVGLSTQIGQLHADDDDELGWHGAAGAHLVGDYGPFNLQLMGVYYTHERPGDGERDVEIGGFESTFGVAADGIVVHANLAYTLAIDGQTLQRMVFYNDYSVVLKQADDYDDSHMNVLGFTLETHHVVCFTEMAWGFNHPFIGADPAIALAAGEPDAEWETRFNVNLGYYF